MGKEITFDNGDEAVINIASFSACMGLKNAIAKALLKQDIKLSDLDISKLDSLIGAILSVDSDEVVNKAIFNCLSKSTYNKERIQESIFEDQKARENYYEILIECLKINLNPFFKPLISKLNSLQEKGA